MPLLVAMLCYAMLCYAMLCYASCYAAMLAAAGGLGSWVVRLSDRPLAGCRVHSTQLVGPS
jgi:hypothetical protein